MVDWRNILYGVCAVSVVVGMFTLSFFENVALGLTLIGMLVLADKQKKGL
jgi:hypothetical protein